MAMNLKSLTIVFLHLGLCQASNSTRHLRRNYIKNWTTGSDIVPYELPWWHPEIQWAVVNKVGGVWCALAMDLLFSI
jgi:hypothetical protein